MYKINLITYSDEDLSKAYQEILEIDRGIPTYGIVDKAHEAAKEVYPEIPIEKIKYSFLKEIARRWDKTHGNNLQFFR